MSIITGSFSRVFVCLVVLCAASALAGAADVYYRATAEDLKWADAPKPTTRGIDWRASDYLAPRIVLDGPGEAYLSGVDRFNPDFRQIIVCVRLPRAGELSGRIFWPAADGKSISVHPFKVALDPPPEAQADFTAAKIAHYERLTRARDEGAAWFRHQIRLARGDKGQPQTGRNTRFIERDHLSETFDLFSGGRAVSENLQLDRMLPTTRPDNPTVPLADIPGIVIKEMDFAPLIADLTKALPDGAKFRPDALASLIPADQHAVFFPSFAALAAASDEASLNVTAAGKLSGAITIEPSVRQRYERQLGLPLTALGRLLGPALIDGVAITGSDPYFLVGTDVAVIFGAKDPAALLAAIRTQGQIQIAGSKDVKRSAGKTSGGVDYTLVRSNDRSVCSYTAIIGNAVVVTNSPAQLERLAGVKPETSLARSPEYTFFRLRYPLGDKDETALAVLTDATIRRWCSPRWRIADSRRTLAAAVMSDLQAKVIETNPAPGVLTSDFALPDAGELRVDADGQVTSGVYNTLAFMTPISELEFDKVTKDESDFYTRWRNSYQQNWTNFFDPLALRLSISPTKLGADLTVMPLIEDSQYRWLIDLTQGAKLSGQSGDRHEAWLQIVAGLDPKSPDFKQYGNMFKTFTGNLRVEPLAWVGESASIYLDDDPFWADLAKAEDKNDFMEKHIGRLPVALWVRNANSLRLAAFMAMMRGFIDQSAPGLLAWETLNHNDQPYVKVSATPKARAEQPEIPDMAVFYAATPRALIVTPSEALLKRALDREKARDGKAVLEPRPPGDNVALFAKRSILELGLTIMNDDLSRQRQLAAWRNIPILNEWKRLFPKENPLDVHERYWHVRLSDPLGGGYDWCAQHATMQSINFGHPGHAKTPPPDLMADQHLLKNLQTIEAGLTFEHGGLRAKVEAQRTK